MLQCLFDYEGKGPGSLIPPTHPQQFAVQYETWTFSISNFANTCSRWLSGFHPTVLYCTWARKDINGAGYTTDTKVHPYLSEVGYTWSWVCIVVAPYTTANNTAWASFGVNCFVGVLAHIFAILNQISPLVCVAETENNRYGENTRAAENTRRR